MPVTEISESGPLCSHAATVSCPSPSCSSNFRSFGSNLFAATILPSFSATSPPFSSHPASHPASLPASPFPPPPPSSPSCTPFSSLLSPLLPPLSSVSAAAAAVPVFATAARGLPCTVHVCVAAVCLCGCRVYVCLRLPLVPPSAAPPRSASHRRPSECRLGRAEQGLPACRLALNSEQDH